MVGDTMGPLGETLVSNEGLWWPNRGGVSARPFTKLWGWTGTDDRQRMNRKSWHAVYLGQHLGQCQHTEPHPNNLLWAPWYRREGLPADAITAQELQRQGLENKLHLRQERSPSNYSTKYLLSSVPVSRDGATVAFYDCFGLFAV